MPAPRPGLLSARRERTVRALLPVFCPPDAEDPATADAVMQHVELTAASLHPLTRRLLLTALDVVELAGVRRGRRTSLLPAAERRNVVDRLRRSSPALQRLVSSVRDVIVVAYFDQPQVKDHLGYRPDPWTDAMRQTRLERWGPEIARHEELLRTPMPRPPLER